MWPVVKMTTTRIVLLVSVRKHTVVKNTLDFEYEYY